MAHPDQTPRAGVCAVPDGVWTIVVAGGGGTRFGGPKHLVEIAGRRVIDWSVDAARTVAAGVVAVVPAGDVDLDVPGADVVVAGGATRAESVRCGLAAVPADATVIVVHDAARPAALPQLFEQVIAAVAGDTTGAVPGIAVTDSLRLRRGGAVERDEFVAVQTPQAFAAGALRAAHTEGDDATDDATLVERLGGTIAVVEGDVDNRKLTHPDDLVALERVLASDAEGRG